MGRSLFWAIACNQFDLALTLASKGRDIHRRNSDGCTPLFYAASQGLLELVQVLLEQGADPNARDKDDETVLMWAAGEGHAPVIEALIQAGADVNYKNPDTGYTALIWAAQFGHMEVVEMLLGQGAETDCADKWGQTALDKASGGHHEKTVQVLLTAGAVLNQSRRTTPCTGRECSL